MAPHGEPQGEAAPRARLALDRDAAVMGLRHVLHQREAHASAPPPLSLAPPHPVEFLEDLPLLLRGDPHALVRGLTRYDARRRAASVTRPISSVSPNIRMTDSGVLRSWDTFATKSDLSWAISASRRMSRQARTRPARMTMRSAPKAAVKMTTCRRTVCRGDAPGGR